MSEEKPKHFEGQCTSSCRRVGCPEYDIAMEEMECWSVDNHLKKCAKHKNNKFIKFLERLRKKDIYLNCTILKDKKDREECYLKEKGYKFYVKEVNKKIDNLLK